MSKPGKELEIIVAQIEEVLSGSILKVKSPDRVYDYNAKKEREVDVTIRGKFGSSDILVIIECRDRKGAEDITWIEELVTKQGSYHANKMVALSSSKFSKGAIELAKVKGIELRQMKTFKPEEVKTWLTKINVQIVNSMFQITGMNLQLDLQLRKKLPKKKLKNIKPDDNIFIVKKTGNKISANYIFNDFDAQNNHICFSQIEKDRPPIKKCFLLPIDKNAPIQIQIGRELFDVKVVELTVLLGIKSIIIPSAEVKHYMLKDMLLGEMAIYKGSIDKDKEFEMRIIGEPAQSKGQRIAFSIKQIKDKV